MANVIMGRARTYDISERTLLRAKSVLGVISRKEGDGGWWWHLPGKEDRKAAR